MVLPVATTLRARGLAGLAMVLAAGMLFGSGMAAADDDPIPGRRCTR